MHIVVCGPATLSAFQHLVGRSIETAGYPFPGTSALALHYVQRGHKVSVVTTASDVGTLDIYNSPQLDLYVVPSRARARDRALDFFSAERRGLGNVLEKLQADVIHAHWTYEFGLAARAAECPSLVTVHDWAPAVVRHNRHPYWYFRAAMQARCLIAGGALSAPTRYIAAKVKRVYGKNVVTIPNGVDLEKYIDLRPETKATRVGMLNVGFSSLKNVSTALRAWANFFENHPEGVLHLAGPGYAPGDDADHWARARNLHHGVVFDGPIPNSEVPSWFVDKTVFLHSSLEESFGVALVEAMASGVPIVAGQHSGAVSEVTGGAALLTDVTSAQAIGDALETVISRLDLQKDLKIRGLDRAKSFSQAAVGDAFLAELEAISSAQQ